jgi:2-C-methyl-D-erythritol 4-phosphate cytidylyltransferase
MGAQTTDINGAKVRIQEVKAALATYQTQLQHLHARRPNLVADFVRGITPESELESLDREIEHIQALVVECEETIRKLAEEIKRKWVSRWAFLIPIPLCLFYLYLVLSLSPPPQDKAELWRRTGGDILVSPEFMH